MWVLRRSLGGFNSRTPPSLGSGGERVGVIGGGPENTAIALARLGHRVEFIDGISSDKWGVAAKKELDADGVGTTLL
jgi:sugar/nucleoside kinase (ribokinase family)